MEPRPPSPTIRPLDSPALTRQAVELYRDVFGLAETDPAVSPRLLAALLRNGGSVLGAFARPDTGGEERMVGFVYGFLGTAPQTGEVYHYSQMAVVDRRWQGRGIGRALKLGQRAYVLETGVTRMRWAYDPLRTANGHFNLDVLGTQGRWFVESLYGVDDMGRDLGLRSDRLIVEWDLTRCPEDTVRRARPEPRRPLQWGQSETGETGQVLLAVPRDWDGLVRADRDRAVSVRDQVCDRLAELVHGGHAAVSCQSLGTDTAVYLLAPE